jgi:hypothetical protein
MSFTTNQGFVLPDLSDPANVPLTFSEFVLGTTAANGIENHTVQRYLSPADRTARNAAPNTGELSFLTSSGAYEYFNGTAWTPLQKGFVSDLTRGSNNAGFTAETVQDFITFTSLGPAVRYKLAYNSNCQSTAATDLVRVRLKWQTGGTLTTGGTLFDGVEITMPNINRSAPVTRVATVTGIPAGTASIGATMERGLGTGTLTSTANGTTQIVYTLLEID